MTRLKFCAQNERIKHDYLQHLSGPKGLSAATTDQVAAALTDFERATGHKEFRMFRKEHAQRYQRYLADLRNSKTGKGLSHATISSRLAALKAFFQWLSRVRGYRRLNWSDFDYFNHSAKGERIAKASRLRPVPSIEQIRHVLETMPTDTAIGKRDRALIAFTLLSGSRDNAVASMSLKHVDLEARKVHHDAREVRTKNSKTFTSDFFPVGEEIEKIVADWVEYLRTDLLWGPDDPLFPSTRVALNGNGQFESAGLERRHWQDAAAIRKIFKQAFTAAGLPYFNPHSFRNTLAMLGEKLCPNPEAFKAWSQNLGHSHVLTTFMSYGAVPPHRQEEIFVDLSTAKTSLNDEGSTLAEIEQLLRKARNSGCRRH